MTKYIFVTGGVISGLGKGVISASIGSILQMLNQNKVTIKKLDPYLNIDPGTMNPNEHGEVFVTEDGTEADLDLGYYERFLENKTSNINSTSSGKLFQKILNKERRGDYLGKTVQMIPQFTNIIKEFICYNPNNYEYIICEIGGCVGDIEAMAFYEALRQLRNDLGVDNMIFIHLTYLVYYLITNEIKTKPTQNSIRELQQVGIIPDILICRTEKCITSDIKKKLSLHTNLLESNIIDVINFSSIYETPLFLINKNIHNIIINKFKINSELSLIKWTSLNNKIKNCNKTINIGLLGKYTELNDSYKSLIEAISHAGFYYNHNINIIWIDAKKEIIYNNNNINGIVIPGGFGNSGIENMIYIIQKIRNLNIPILGICLGMQLMIIEFFRNIINNKEATSEEFDKNGQNIITKLKVNDNNIGGTMRLGLKEIMLKPSKIKAIYNKNNIFERHRHRYYLDYNFKDILYDNGCLVSGYSDNIVELIELEKHPWYIGCQYHPEYNSTPFNPHPLFISFIKHSLSV